MHWQLRGPQGIASLKALISFAPALAAAVIACQPVSVSASGGETIVSSQVISDTVVDGGTTMVGDGTYVGDEVVVGGSMMGGRTYGQPDLFYNYYTQGMANQANAQMYLSPVPVPPNVGHTFYTYQPLYPHELLYWHKDRYHNYYDNGRGLNRTRINYGGNPIHQAASNIYWNYLRLPR